MRASYSICLLRCMEGNGHGRIPERQKHGPRPGKVLLLTPLKHHTPCIFGNTQLEQLHHHIRKIAKE